MKQFRVKYQVIISHDDESKDLNIPGDRIYEAKSSSQAKELLMEDWDNGMESDFVDMKHLSEDDIFDICMDILDAKPII